MRKTISSFFAAVIVFGMLMYPAKADKFSDFYEVDFIINGVSYAIMDAPQEGTDGSVYIYDATKEALETDGSFVIPEKVKWKGSSYVVTGLRSDSEVLAKGESGTVTVYRCENLFKHCNKLIIPDTLDYLNLSVFGTKEHPITVVLPKGDLDIYKPHSRNETTKQNRFQYITFDTSRSEVFTVKNNLLIKNKTTLLAPLGGYKSYTIPKEITTVRGFWQNPIITNITIPKTVTAIFDFSECQSLESVVFEKRKTPLKISQYAFRYCNAIESITVPWITADSSECFSEMRGLEKVAFASDYKSLTIPTGAFRGCSKLANVKIPSHITTIKSYAFSGCAIKSITLPKGVSKISNGLFSQCRKLKKIDVNAQKLTSIGKSAFDGCSKLESVTLPKKVTVVSEATFRGCSAIRTVTFNGKVKRVYKSAFSKCSKMTSVTFKGKYLEKFEDYAFYKNTSLKKITISNTKNAPKFTKKTFRKAREGIKFYVKNKTVAKKLKANLKKVGYTSAKIYADGKRYK